MLVDCLNGGGPLFRTLLYVAPTVPRYTVTSPRKNLPMRASYFASSMAVACSSNESESEAIWGGEGYLENEHTPGDVEQWIGMCAATAQGSGSWLSDAVTVSTCIPCEGQE